MTHMYSFQMLTFSLVTGVAWRNGVARLTRYVDGVGSSTINDPRCFLEQ